MDIHLWLTNIVHQKPTGHCKSTILHLKISFKKRIEHTHTHTHSHTHTHTHTHTHPQSGLKLLREVQGEKVLDKTLHCSKKQNIIMSKLTLGQSRLVQSQTPQDSEFYSHI